MKISVKGLIFDYGGTLDTNGVHWGEVIRQAYAAFNVPVSRERFREAYVHVEQKLGYQPLIQPHHTFMETLEIKIKLQFEMLGLTDFALSHQIATFCYEKTVQTIRHSTRVLDVLSKHYPMALVSNFYGNLRTVLREFGLTDYFQAVIESAEAGIRKPDPAIFRLGLDALGFPPHEIAVIGDSYKNDITPATQLGCPAIWLKVKSWHEQDETIAHPYIIQDITQCPPLVIPA